MDGMSDNDKWELEAERKHGIWREKRDVRDTESMSNRLPRPEEEKKKERKESY